MTGTIEFVGGPHDGERHEIPPPFPSRWHFPRQVGNLKSGREPGPDWIGVACHTYRLRRLPKSYTYIYLEAE